MKLNNNFFKIAALGVFLISSGISISFAKSTSSLTNSEACYGYLCVPDEFSNPSCIEPAIAMAKRIRDFEVPLPSLRSCLEGEQEPELSNMGSNIYVKTGIASVNSLPANYSSSAPILNKDNLDFGKTCKWIKVNGGIAKSPINCLGNASYQAETSSGELLGVVGYDFKVITFPIVSGSRWVITGKYHGENVYGIQSWNF
ncbi:MAG: hypothetical protein R3Y52_01215 [Psittacicella sp.]